MVPSWGVPSALGPVHKRTVLVSVLLSVLVFVEVEGEEGVVVVEEEVGGEDVVVVVVRTSSKTGLMGCCCDRIMFQQRPARENPCSNWYLDRPGEGSMTLLVDSKHLL